MTHALIPVADALGTVPSGWQHLRFATTAWDPTLKGSEHAQLARSRVLEADHAWACRTADDGVACAWLTVNTWDTEFFGTTMAVLGFEGGNSPEVITALLPVAVKHARGLGVRHVRISERTGAPERLHALQSHGFRVNWASVQIVCDTRSLNAAPPITPDGVEFVRATAEHLPALLSAADRLPAYNWLEFDPSLPRGARERYLAQRITNCLTTPYADTCLVALWRGEPSGFHATATCHHQADIPIGFPFAYARETFVAVNAPPRLGLHMLRAALQELRHEVRHVTGRVRLDGRSMLNSALASGYAITADEILLACNLD